MVTIEGQTQGKEGKERTSLVLDDSRFPAAPRERSSTLEIKRDDSEAQASLPVLELYDPTKLPSFSDVCDRRSIVPNIMMQDLVDLSLKSKEARQVLRDLSKGDEFQIYRHFDPIENSLHLLLEMHPELHDRLELAAIRAFRDQTTDDLVAIIADTARTDRRYGALVREVVGAAFKSDARDSKFSGVEILMAMSRDWTEQDLVDALKYVHPDQIRAFKAAYDAAPFEIKKATIQELTGLKAKAMPSPSDLMGGAATLKESSPQVKDRLSFIVTYGDLQFTPQDNPLVRRDGDFFRLNAAIQRRSAEAMERDLYEKGWSDRDRFRGFWGEKREDTRYLDICLKKSNYHERDDISGKQLFSLWGINTTQHGELIDKVVEQYGMDTLLMVDKRLRLYQSLSPTLRRELTGHSEKVDAQQLAGVILNGRLGKPDSLGAFLLDQPPLEERLSEALDKTQERLDKLNGKLKKLQRPESLTQLTELTREGPSTYAIVDHLAERVPLPAPGAEASRRLLKRAFGDPNRKTGFETWIEQQGKMVDLYKTDVKEFESHIVKSDELAKRLGELKLASEVYAYQGLTHSHHDKPRQDFVGLALVGKYGIDVVQDRAPQIWKELNEQGGFSRLKERGLIRSDRFHTYDSQSTYRYPQALATLERLRAGDGGALDLSIRRTQAFQVLDENRALQRTQSTALKFGETLAPFMKLLESGREGWKYDDYVKLVKDKAKDLEKLMGETSAKDIAELKQLRRDLDMSKKLARDPATCEEMDRRSKALQATIELLDPKSAKHQSLKTLLKDTQTRSFHSDDSINWLRNNGPVIAAAAIAAAITIGSMGTASPLAVVLVSSAVALGATQATKEILYQINHSSLTGDIGLGGYNDRSYHGAWASKHAKAFEGLFQSGEWKGTRESAEELITSYLMEVSTPLTMEYGRDVVIQLATLGALRFGEAGIKGLSPQFVKALIANPQTAEMLKLAAAPGTNPAARQFVLHWVKSLGKDVAEELIEEGFEDGTATVAERSLRSFGPSGSAMSAMIPICMAVLRGKGRSLAKATGHNEVSIHPDAQLQVIESLRLMGLVVEETNDGKYRVTAHGATDALIIRTSADVTNADGSVGVKKNDQAGDRESTTGDTDTARNREADSKDRDSADVTYAAVEPSDESSAKFLSSKFEREIDKKVQEALAPLREKLRNGEKVDEATKKQYLDAATEILLPHAQDFAKRLGMPPTVISKFDFTFAEMQTGGDFNSRTGKIRISLTSEAPLRCARHEITHKYREMVLMAAKQADPKGFKRLLLDRALADIGQPGLYAPEAMPERRVKLDKEGARALRDLVEADVRAQLSDADADAKSQPEYVIPDVLLKAFDGDVNAVYAVIAKEAAHVLRVMDGFDHSTDAYNTDSKLFIEKTKQYFEESAKSKNYPTISSNPLIEKLLKMPQIEIMGRFFVYDLRHLQHYAFSPSEIDSRTQELTGLLQQMKREAKQEGKTFSVKDNPEALQLMDQLSILTVQKELIKCLGDGDLEQAREKAKRLLVKFGAIGNSTLAKNDGYMAVLEFLKSRDLVSSFDLQRRGFDGLLMARRERQMMSASRMIFGDVKGVLQTDTVRNEIYLETRLRQTKKAIAITADRVESQSYSGSSLSEGVRRPDGSTEYKLKKPIVVDRDTDLQLEVHAIVVGADGNAELVASDQTSQKAVKRGLFDDFLSEVESELSERGKDLPENDRVKILADHLEEIESQQSGMPIEFLSGTVGKPVSDSAKPTASDKFSTTSYKGARALEVGRDSRDRSIVFLPDADNPATLVFKQSKEAYLAAGYQVIDIEGVSEPGRLEYLYKPEGESVTEGARFFKIIDGHIIGGADAEFAIVNRSELGPGKPDPKAPLLEKRLKRLESIVIAEDIILPDGTRVRAAGKTADGNLIVQTGRFDHSETKRSKSDAEYAKEGFAPIDLNIQAVSGQVMTGPQFLYKAPSAGQGQESGVILKVGQGSERQPANLKIVDPLTLEKS